MKITKELAGKLAINAQFAFNNEKGKKGTLKVIEHLGYVQIDTLSVVARAHHHTLWSRLPVYREEYLKELQEKDKQIFEYWSHAASYLPMKDYRFSLPRKEAYSKGKSHWFEQDKKIKKFVLDRIKAEGALQSKNFENIKGISGSWYEWKPAKKALEQLFMEGKLMVAKRIGFQKVYDLPERVLPPGINISIPEQDEYAAFLIKSAVKAHGLVAEKEICYLRNSTKPFVSKVLKRLLENKELVEVKVEGINKTSYVVFPENLKQINNFALPNAIYVLSPFDNLVIQRNRLQNFFGFDYMIECYLPEEKRKYGYFTLPVLFNNKFVARLDSKADRATGVFYIKNIFFEKDFLFDEEFNLIFSEKLKEFAAFNACNAIEILKAPLKWKKEIMRLLK